MLALAEDVTKQHPSVRVRMVTARWEDFYTKLPAAVASGQGPDLALMHVDQIPTNAAHGTILPLDDLARDLGLQEDDFAAPVWRAGRVVLSGGRGHDSVVVDPHGEDRIVYHASDRGRTRRQMHVDRLVWDGVRPRVGAA